MAIEQVVNNLIGGVLLEAPPMVDSEEYRRMLNELLDLRGRTLSLMTGAMHEQFSVRRIVTVRWFDPTEYELPHPEPVISLLRDLRNIRLGQAEITSDLAKLKRNSVSLSTVVAIQAARTSSGTPTPKSHVDADILSTLDEALYSILLHALVLRDHLTPDRQPTVLGKALEGASATFEEECFLVLELIKSGYITSNRLNVIPPVDEKKMKNEKEMSLLIRICSLLPMRLTSSPWTGPLDQELMGFQEVVKALYRSLRNLLEVSLAALFLNRKIHLPPHEYAPLAFHLPFYQQSNIAMGLVLKAFLSDGQSPSSLSPTFPNCVDIVGDLKNAYEFWSEVMKMVTFLRDCETLPQELYNEFQNANKFLLSRSSLLE